MPLTLQPAMSQGAYSFTDPLYYYNTGATGYYPNATSDWQSMFTSIYQGAYLSDVTELRQHWEDVYQGINGEQSQETLDSEWENTVANYGVDGTKQSVLNAEYFQYVYGRWPTTDEAPTYDEETKSYSWLDVTAPADWAPPDYYNDITTLDWQKYALDALMKLSDFMANPANFGATAQLASALGIPMANPKWLASILRNAPLQASESGGFLGTFPPSEPAPIVAPAPGVGPIEEPPTVTPPPPTTGTSGPPSVVNVTGEPAALPPPTPAPEPGPGPVQEPPSVIAPPPATGISAAPIVTPVPGVLPPAPTPVPPPTPAPAPGPAPTAEEIPPSSIEGNKLIVPGAITPPITEFAPTPAPAPGPAPGPPIDPWANPLDPEFSKDPTYRWDTTTGRWEYIAMPVDIVPTPPPAPPMPLPVPTTPTPIPAPAPGVGPPLGEFAYGTPGPLRQGQIGLVGEQTPEVAYLPPGSIVAPAGTQLAQSLMLQAGGRLPGFQEGTTDFALSQTPFPADPVYGQLYQDDQGAWWMWNDETWTPYTAYDPTVLQGMRPNQVGSASWSDLNAAQQAAFLSQAGTDYGYDPNSFLEEMRRYLQAGIGSVSGPRNIAAF